MKTKFGLLGGAGSVCSQEIYKQILDHFSQKEEMSDSTYPYLLVSNFPFSCLNEHGISNFQTFKEEINHALKDLKTCDHIFVLCNSFHFNLQEYISPNLFEKIIELPSLALSRVNKNKKYLLLASQFSYEKEVFSHPNVIYPSIETQNLINEIIRRKILNLKIEADSFLNAINKDIQYFQAEGIIVGCTEFYNINYSPLKDIDVINPLHSICDIIYQDTKNESL